MKVKVIGKKKTEFTDQKTGEFKQFARLYYTFNAPGNSSFCSYEGMLCDSKSIPFNDLSSIDIGDVLQLDFDEKSRVIGIELVGEA